MMSNVPKLRFKEFSGDWEEKTIKEVSTKVTDGTHDTPKPVENGIPYLTAIHVKDGFLDFDNCYFLPEDEHNKIYKRCNPEYGDLLLVNIGAGTATTAMVKVNYEFSLKNVALIKPNKQLLEPEFLYQIQHMNAKRLNHKLTSGGAQPFLSLKEIAKIKLTIPSKQEQEKIASFLTSVDTKIEQLTKKEKLLKQYKKGVMQQIFSGDIRFKADDGSEFLPWKLRKLKDVLKEHKSKSTGKEEVFSVSVHKGLINQIEHLGRSFAAKDTDNYNVVKPNDIVYTKSPTGDFPYGIIKQSKIDYDVIVSPLYGVFTPETSGLGYIIHQYFESKINVHNYLHSIIQKGAKNTINITNNTFLSKSLMLPTDKNEQTKIANFLSSMDSKIEQVQKQLGLSAKIGHT